MNRKAIKYIIGAVTLGLAVLLFILSRLLFGISIHPEGGRSVIHIPDSSSYEQAMDSVFASLEMKNPGFFRKIAVIKHYPSLVKPGRYVIDKGYSCNGLINLLRIGRQSPVRITFNNVRTLNDIAGKIGSQIEADSASIMEFFSSPENYSKDGFKREDVVSVFIPDTYEFYWNTSAKGLYSRMLREYKKFWNRERLEKAKELGITPIEVSILASIIDDEVAKPDEKSRIAGVYLNRLKRGIPLQACPTIKFALNDFTITRVLYKHLVIDSPYNTYKHTGFPPGPIGCPSIEGLDAVLNAEKHDYLYFAAKADFSGYHNFSRTLAEHNRYANQYQRELNRRRIFR
ncbi:MAG: endolytic transglycosylase MltG [Bacteroidota bacterium]|nr:endolytic transglycosylase MltG [Bacteroidota bacterium]